MQHTLRRLFSALTCVALFAHSATAELKVAGGYLIGQLDGSTEYTTNAEARKDGDSDFIARLTPSVTYQTVGATSNIQVKAGYTFLRYAKLDEYDGEDYDISASLSYPNGLELPYSYTVSAGVNERTQADAEYGSVTRNRNYSASSNGTYKLSNLYWLAAGLDYSETDPLDDNGNGNDSYATRETTTTVSIPVTINYRYSELLSYGGGYQFRKQESSGSSSTDQNSTDHAVFGLVNGQIFPLVDASIRLGAQLREFESGGNTTSPYASGDVTWQATSLTTVGFSISADYSSTTANQVDPTYSFQTSLSHQLQSNLTANLSTGIRLSEYSNQDANSGESRENTEWQIGAGLGTTLYKHTNLSLALNYTDTTSTLAESEYDELSIQISASRPF